MVVRLQLTIRHIRGHSFSIETDAESDILGLKLQIWESQKIPIENQRLVFGGKELQDNITLSQANIGDNAILFLVEAIADVPRELQAEVPPQVVVQAPIQVVPPAFTNANMVADGVVPISTGSVVYQQPCVTNVIPPNVNYHGPLELETALSKERIQSVIDLSRWVRIYCIFGLVVTAISCFISSYLLLLFLVYVCGYIGTRRLNCYLLGFPLVLSFIIGFVGFPFNIYYLFFTFYAMFVLMGIFACFFHILIFASICKLISRIKQLSSQERCQTLARIRTKKCC